MNKRLVKAKLEHEAWLEKRGLTRKQIRSKRTNTINRIPDLSVKEVSPVTNKFANTGFKKSIMEARFKESPEVRAEIERKANSIAPSFNKGPAQPQFTLDDAKNIGRK